MLLAILLHDGNQPWEHLVMWGVVIFLVVLIGVSAKKNSDKSFHDKQLPQ